MDWAQILVIILGTLFAVFLLLAVLLAVLLVKITRQIKTTASSAERTVAALEGAFTGLSKSSMPLTILRVVLKQVMKAKSQKSKGSNTR